MHCERMLVEETSVSSKSSPRTPGSLSARIKEAPRATRSLPKRKMTAALRTTEDEEDLSRPEEEEEAEEEDQEEMECDADEGVETQSSSDKSGTSKVWGGKVTPGEALTWEGDSEDLKLNIRSACLTDARGKDDVVVGVTVSDLTRHPIASFTPGKTSMAAINATLPGPVTFQVLHGDGTVHLLGNVTTDTDLSPLLEFARSQQENSDEETSDEDYVPGTDEDDESEEDEDEDSDEEIENDELNTSGADEYYILSDKVKADLNAIERKKETIPEESEEEDEKVKEEEEVMDDSEEAADEDNTAVEDEEDEEEDEDQEASDGDEDSDEVADADEEKTKEVEVDNEDDDSSDEDEDEDDEAEEIEEKDSSEEDADKEAEEIEEKNSSDEEDSDEDAKEMDEKGSAEEDAEEAEDDDSDSDTSNSRYKVAFLVLKPKQMEKIEELEKSLSRKRKSCPRSDSEENAEEDEAGARKRRKSLGSLRGRQTRTPSFELRSHERE